MSGKSVNETKTDKVPLSGNARMMLKLAADGNGIISFHTHLQGVNIYAGGKEIEKSAENKVKAMWKSVVNELLELSLVENKNNRRDVDIFEVTHEGHLLAEKIRPEDIGESPETA